MATKKQKQTNDKQREAMRALAMIAPRLLELDERELVRPNFSIPRAAATALAAEPKIKRLAQAIARDLPRFRLEMVRELRPIALATWYLHVAPRPAIDEDRVKRLVTEGAPLKRTLLLQATALVDRKQLDAAQVEAIRKGRGNLDLANDLLALSQLFRTHWDLIRTKVAIVEEDELDRAAELGTTLLEALGARQVTPETRSQQEEAADLRARAATLLVRTYDELRAAISYLRRTENDADEIAPSLYAVGPRRRAPEPEAAIPEEAAPIER